MRKSKKSFSLFDTALKRFAPAAVAYGLARIATQASRMGRQLEEASERTGFSVETLRALQMAGRDAGVTIQTTTMALQRFNRRVGEIANTGRGELAPTFEQLGIAIRTSGGELRGIEDILEEFTRKLNGIESAAQRAALAQKAFDSEGVAFGLQVLKNVDSMEKLRGEIEDTGRALDSETLEILSAWDIFLGKLADRAATLGAQLTAALVDPLVDTRSELERRAQENADRFAAPPGLRGGPPGADADPRTHAGGAFSPGFAEQTAPQAPAFDGSALREWAAAREAAERRELAAQIAERDALDAIAAAMGPRPESDAMAGFFDAQAIEQFNNLVPEAEAQYSQFSAAILSENEIIESSLFGMTSSFASSISQALTSGKLDFESFARSAVASIAQIITQQLLLRAVMASPLGGLFPSAKGNVIGPAGPLPSAKGNVIGPSGPEPFAVGGVVAKRLEKPEPFAVGGVVAKRLEKPEPFAVGGVVNSPTLFAMGGSGRLGLMGEAGPEGILPLRRDPQSGRLGVEASGMGGGSSSVVVNVTNNAPNSEENDGRLGRVIAAQVREAWNVEARRQMRPGGTLNPIGANV